MRLPLGLRAAPAAVALYQHAARVKRHSALLLALEHVVHCGGHVQQRADVDGRIDGEMEAGGGLVAGVGDELVKKLEVRSFVLKEGKGDLKELDVILFADRSLVLCPDGIDGVDARAV